MKVRYTYKMPDAYGRWYEVQATVRHGRDSDAFRNMLADNQYILLKIEYLAA